MDRISSILPPGNADEATHHGARRRSRRYPLSGEVELIEPAWAKGMVINASAGGLRVGLDRVLDAGEECLVEVRTSARQAWRERARVVWRRELPDGYLMGLEFLAAA